MIKPRVFYLLAVFVLGMTGSSIAQAQCFSVVSKITRNWSEVKQIMLPLRGKLNRAKRDDFYCVSARYVYRAMERRVSRSAELKCYTDPGGKGLGMCCDLGLTFCAQLRPDIVPEEAQRRVAKKKVDPDAKPSSASWMKVPTDEDQWVTPPPED